MFSQFDLMAHLLSREIFPNFANLAVFKLKADSFRKPSTPSSQKFMLFTRIASYLSSPVSTLYARNAWDHDPRLAIKANLKLGPVYKEGGLP